MEDKKYYWLKLKRDFFKRHDIQIVESMPNGKDYILFYLKLLCESVDHEGNLRFSDSIPYNEQMLSTITNTNVDIVRNAIKVFTELKMMETLDDGTIYMNEVSKMIGCETYWAGQKRIQREREKQLELDNVQQMSLTCPTCPSKSKRKSKSKSIDKDINTLCTEQSNDCLVPTFNLPLNTNENYPFYETDLEEYKKLYPAINVEQEFRNMLGWLNANPKNRKTKQGIKRFVNSWLSRSQDKASKNQSKSNSTQKEYYSTFNDNMF